MKRYLILLFFIILYFCYSQNIKYLSENVMRTIAIENFKINFATDQLKELLKKNGTYFGYDTTAGTRFFELLNIIKDTSRIVVRVSEEENYWKDKFLIFKITKKYYQNWYTTAIGYDGMIYHLSGYKEMNFNDLFEQKIGIVTDEQNAIKVARLYLTYVVPETLAHRIIIDTNNINQYNTKYPELHKINVNKWLEGEFTVGISTLDEDIGRIINHHFEFHGSRFKYETKLIRQDREYRYD